MSVRRTHARPVLRAAAVASAAAGLALVAGPASAHVSATPTEGAAGSYTVTTFSVPHGCEGEATTSITIKIPDEIIEVTPTRNALWNVTKTLSKLATPLTAEDGDEITEKVGSVTYTAKTPLPDGYRDTFELSFQVPDAVGKTLAFPVAQQCENGKKTDWNQTVAEGEAEPEHPAPTFTVTEASAAGDDHHSGGTEAAEGAESTAAHDEKSDSDGASKGLAYTGLGVGVLGLLVGGAALAKSGRKA